MTCHSIQRFCGAPTHQALAPSSPILLHRKLMFATDAFIFSTSAKAWRQRHSISGPFGQNLISEMLKNAQKKGHSTETCPISRIQNLEKQSRNPVSFSIYVQSHTAGLGVFDISTRSDMNDETTVTTAPANHPNFFLLEDFENMTS